MSSCTDLVLLDGYLDGALTRAEAEAYERHVAGCSTCSSEIALALQVRTLLTATPEVCPPDVIESALARIESDRRPVRLATDRPSRVSPRITRFRLTVLALAASAILAALAVSPMLRPRPAVVEPEQPSPAEVARARADVERALGLVGEATRDAGVFLRDDILAPHVAEPAAESVLDALGLSN